MSHQKNFAVMLAAAMFSACSSPVRLNDTPVADRPLASAATAAPVAGERDVRPVQTGSVDPLFDAKGVLSQRSVFFDYDSYVLGDQGRRVVENHAGFLTKNTRRRVIIQGNTDERGGTEYNLALGQRRAEAVRKSLAALGVAESQMEAVSLGEVKPQAAGSDEAAWARNRRADIVY